jgi:hypothetical protein
MLGEVRLALALEQIHQFPHHRRIPGAVAEEDVVFEIVGHILLIFVVATPCGSMLGGRQASAISNFYQMFF